MLFSEKIRQHKFELAIVVVLLAILIAGVSMVFAPQIFKKSKVNVANKDSGKVDLLDKTIKKSEDEKPSEKDDILKSRERDHDDSGDDKKEENSATGGSNASNQGQTSSNTSNSGSSLSGGTTTNGSTTGSNTTSSGSSGGTTPGTPATPAIQPPVSPPPTTPPTQTITKGVIVTSYSSSNANNHQALVGSSEDVLVVDVGAENEDIYLTEVIFSHDQNMDEVNSFELYGAENVVSLAKVIGTEKTNVLGNKVQWKWRIVDGNVLKIKAGEKATLTLKVKYGTMNGMASLTGTKLNFSLDSINGRGAISKESIIGKTNNIKSKTVLLVESYPTIKLLSTGGTISGGVQEIMRFNVAAAKNDYHSWPNKLYLNYIDIYTPAVSNVSIDKVSIEPIIMPFNYANVTRCQGLNAYQWRCYFSTNSLNNEIMGGDNTDFIVKAEVGLNNNGEFNVKATPVGMLTNFFGGLNFAGALSWNNSGTYYDMLTWVDNAPHMTVNWKGTGIGALYDNTPPAIQTYSATNGGVLGVIDNGDVIKIEFDQPIAPYSVVSGLVPGGSLIKVAPSNTGSVTTGRGVNSNMVVINNIVSLNQSGSASVSDFWTRLSLDSSGKILTIKLTDGTAQTLHSPFIADNGSIASNNQITDMTNNKMEQVSVFYSNTMNF